VHGGSDIPVNNKRRSFMLIVLGLGLVVTVRAQATPKLEFDVASVKQNVNPDAKPFSNFPLGPGAMYSPNGGVFSARKQPALVYIMFAYKLSNHELLALSKQLPSWASEEQYDIEAKTDNQHVTKDEMRLMMQSLLADRFKLALHSATEQVPVYALVVAKPGALGPRLRPHPADDASCSSEPPVPNAEAPAAHPSTTVAGGFPLICGGQAILPPSAPGRIASGYRNVPLSLIAQQMTLLGGLDRPVVDQTGLTGNFDFSIEFSPETPPSATPSAADDNTGPTFRRALLEQTGLKLVSEKAPVTTLVVEHIERPTVN
jgi:uncharacterized protein (TIGR03435 family)